MSEKPASVTGVVAASLAQSRESSLTLVEGSSFCLSGKDGAITPGGAQGLFVRDTRVLSRWELTCDGRSPDVLAVVADQPFSCRFVGRLHRRCDGPDATIMIERRRSVGAGMREDVILANYGTEPADVELRFAVDADFADIFEVRGAPGIDRSVSRRVADGCLELRAEQTGGGRGLRIVADGARLGADEILLTATVPPHGVWSTTVQLLAMIGAEAAPSSFPTDQPVECSSTWNRATDWGQRTPGITVDHAGLAQALAVSSRDLGALRLPQEGGTDEAVAAGAPWFMTLFGRDSLLTSSMLLPYFPGLALGTLRSLAARQGQQDDPQTEEQPGKILHEVRQGADLSLALGGSGVYYGSIDSTPLFVRLVGETLRWGANRDDIAALMPAVDRAMAWISDYGDRDGDGFVEYLRTSDHGLLHQGWKDSSDPINFLDGRLADPPIALAEVQGYVYAALQARARLARFFDDDPAPWSERAADLQSRFHRAFWLPDLGYYAVALDGDKRAVDSPTSNIGHCLWSGIVPTEFAGRVVERLLGPDLFTGFGIRTLSSAAGRYNPASYHNGSVWPHDSVLVAAGVSRYGFREQAGRILAGLVEAATVFGGRLPELFCGYAADTVPVPVPYPTSCSPQAWAAAVPFQVLTTALGLEADLDEQRFTAGPALPMLGGVRVDDLRCGPFTLSLRAEPAGEVAVTGLP